MQNQDLKPLIIAGAGGLGREVASLISGVGQSGPSWNLLGFVDDKVQAETVEGWPVFGPISGIYAMKPFPWVAIAIADPYVRKRLYMEMKEKGIPIATLTHSSCIISEHVAVGEGSILCAGSIITTNVTLGTACIVNPGDFIGHDTILGDWVSMMPSVSVAGEVMVGQGCYLGINSCVINQTTIGEWSVIGAGATVTGEIPPYSLAVGVPARVIRSLPKPVNTL